MRQRIEMIVLVVALIVVGIAPGIVVAQVFRSKTSSKRNIRW